MVAVLALALGLATPSPARATTPVCSTDATFCISYAATASTTATQQPVDLTIDLANTSPSHDTDTGTWVHQVSVRPLAVSLTSGPLITRSADLPNGLLVAGSSAGCGTGNGCSAGYGIGYAQGGYCATGICTFTFGIQRVANVQATTHRNEFAITLTGCLTAPINLCGSFGDITMTKDVWFDPPADGPSTTEMTFVLDPTGSGFDNFTIDQLHLTLNGTVDQYRWFRLPPTCGSASGSATATDNAGKSATATADFTVTGCLDVTGTASTPQVRYGGHATLAGGLTPSDDTSPAVAGAALLLRTCPAGRACTTSPATAGPTGGWSFAVTPQRTTTYSVLYAGPAGDTDWVPVGRSFTVRVVPLVSRRASAAHVPHGGRVTISGAVTPNDAGAKVALQRYLSGSWRTIATTTVTSRSTYALSARLAGRAGTTARLRVRVAGNSRFVTATSAALTIGLT
ncbi:hypothetical protein GCM10028772_31760 [Nocardioides ultimimeridianus]